MKFIHLRLRNNKGQPATRGGVTVAYEPQLDGSILYAIARCNPTDNYNRAYGRAKSSGRLHSEKQQRTIRSDNHASPIQRVVLDLVERGIWNGV